MGGEASKTAGAHMAGAQVDVKITPQALSNKPDAPVLTSPERAIRSYLDWTSYAYRTAQSAAAVPTMSTYEEVRVDSYVQYNIQKSRVMDQRLDSITFGRPSIDATRATLPAREKWTYTYVSINDPGKVIGGPYEASYDTTYTVIKNKQGAWVVDKVKAKALEPVK